MLFCSPSTGLERQLVEGLFIFADRTAARYCTETTITQRTNKEQRYNRIKLYASDHQKHNFLPLTLLPQFCTFHHAKFPLCNPNQPASDALHRAASAQQNLETAPSRTQSTRLNPKQLPPGHQTPQTRRERRELSDRRRSCPCLNGRGPRIRPRDGRLELQVAPLNLKRLRRNPTAKIPSRKPRTVR